MSGTEFDAKVRAKLSESREQLPEGLWDGIESRLAGVPARRGTSVLRRWAVGVSSVAAVLAVGFVTAHFVRSGMTENGVDLPSATAEGIPAETAEGGPEGAGDVQVADAAATVVMADAAGAAGTAGDTAGISNAQSAGKPAGTVDAARTGYSAVAGEDTGAGNAEARKSAESGTGDALGTAGCGEKIDVVKTDGGTGLLAMSGEEYELDIDNSDIKAVYGNDTEVERKTPFEITVGGNSFAGPQKEQGLRRMMSRGQKTQPSKTFEEGGSSASYSLPLSFGVGLKYDVTGWFGIGIGVNYTLLNKKVRGIWYDEHGWSSSTDMKNSQHYIGIPVDVYFSMFRNNRWNAYAAVGGAVEKCVANRYAGTLDEGPISYTKKAKGVQMSVKAGIGIEFSPLEFLGIYIDPSVRYFFDNGQPRSIRTEQPLSLGIEAGLRFKLSR